MGYKYNIHSYSYIYIHFLTAISMCRICVNVLGSLMSDKSNEWTFNLIYIDIFVSIQYALLYALFTKWNKWRTNVNLNYGNKESAFSARVRALNTIDLNFQQKHVVKFLRIRSIDKKHFLKNIWKTEKKNPAENCNHVKKREANAVSCRHNTIPRKIMGQIICW